jgi:pimeloyl-ACP methyl ester carboxylesterase
MVEPGPAPRNYETQFVDIGGIATHYLSAGDPDAPLLVLLHSGEFGGCAELSWEHNLAALAEHFRILAPDFLGFGRTDKLRDFGSHGRRMITHLTDFLTVMDVQRAHFVGNSVSGRFLCKVAAAEQPSWPIDRMICISGGGFEPDNEERRTLQDYDGSDEAMRRVLGVLFHASPWTDSPDYLRRRQEFARMPGAWEVAAAARFRAPWQPERPMFGRPDKTEYEKISAPTLFVAGGHDRLLPPGYWVELAERTPRGDYAVFENSSHCPHIEEAEAFNDAAIEFLTRAHDS